ncbi:MAG: glutathione peroxidase [Tractidigestivibacter sp.]|jgi:glutathione peroxidase|uniref:glutathione peroxidase n=1 Tax=Tractidigestivibacter sp. TaxID=2847320 RepID=UPI003D8D59D6
MSVYDFSVKNRDGSTTSLKDYAGKVLLIVNTATGCGFTPTYEDLERIYKTYRDKGFEILDFPCNQFLGQAPGTDEEIHSFCTLKFGTEFPQFKKIDVNGPDADPLFVYLKEQQGFTGLGDNDSAEFMAPYVAKVDPNWENDDDIKWNFTKFLVDRKGNVVARFEPTVGLEPVEAAIKDLL